MKKVILILTCLISMITLCGCTHIPSPLETNDVSEYIVCIDGIEYIKYTAGYTGYMAPHLKADKFDNPKVVRCTK